jgi:hypothetical protein
MGGRTNVRGGVLSLSLYPPELTNIAGKAGATGTRAAGAK